jgi:hypothetical protein
MKNTRIETIRASFSGILCCINFNTAHYNNIPFLTELYGGFFDMVFYGPGALESPKVYKISHHEGYFGYGVLIDAIKRFPKYKGYIFLNDDCIMHPWRFKAKDKTKLWVQPFNTMVNRHKVQQKWNWLYTRYGVTAYNNAFEKIPDRYRNRLDDFCGNSNIVVCGPADFFYLPRKFADDFICLFNIFFSHNVFTEIAVPTGIRALASQARIDTVKSHYDVQYALPFVDYNKRIHLKTLFFYNGRLDVYHPIKLSEEKNRNRVNAVFQAYFHHPRKLFSLVLRIKDASSFLVWFWAYAYVMLLKIWRRRRSWKVRRNKT